MGLEAFAGRDPATLSGGQKARVALLRVLLSQPRAILLVFPNERHMPRGDHDRAYLERRIVEYFERHL